MNNKYKYIILVLFAALASCHSAHEHESNNDESDDHDHGETIHFSNEEVEKLGIEFEQVKTASFHQIIKTSGRILSAQGDEAIISANMAGIVSFNNKSLNEGASVKRGENLLNISSQNLQDGDPILKAQNTYQAAKKEFERAQKLIVDKLISEVEYNNIKLNYDNALAAYSSFSKRQTARGLSVNSPMDGFIKSKLVDEGEYVELGQAIAVITQSRRLKLTADISERYFKYLHTIKTANFKIPYDNHVYELTALNGKVSSYGRSLKENEYTLPISFEFDNIGNIISGSFVDVYLLSDERDNVISVPVTALVEDQGVYYVFTKIHEDEYIKNEVKLGANNGSLVEILSGIKDGDIIVAKSAIHLQLASSSDVMPHAH